MQTVVRDIGTISVGERRRQDMGDVGGLAKSLAKVGLLHPIVIDTDNRLVAGGRRLAAAKSLGWERIDCRLYGTLTESERREIELEENLQRKDLTPGERDKVIVRLAEVAAQVDRESFVKSVDDQAHNAEKPGSLRRIADRIGISHEAVRNAQQATISREQHALPPETPQATALTFAKAVAKTPELVAQPIEAVVSSYEAQRQAERAEKAQRHADRISIIEQQMSESERQEQEARQHRQRVGEHLKAGYRALACEPDALVQYLDDGLAQSISTYIVQSRVWCDKWEKAIRAYRRHDLRMVGGDR